jgi:hypothetical protein
MGQKIGIFECLTCKQLGSLNCDCQKKQLIFQQIYTIL